MIFEAGLRTCVVIVENLGMKIIGIGFHQEWHHGNPISIIRVISHLTMNAGLEILLLKI